MRYLMLIFLSLGLLAGCAGRPTLEGDKLSGRELNLEEFFAGDLVAHGQFQDLFGNVSRRFAVDITGRWDGRLLTLVEDFVYEDSSTERRVWTLERTGAETWRGTAPGVIGEATGEERGDVFNWQYRIDLPVGDETVRVRFDDWMWLVAENRVLNRAYMYRYGLRVGEVVIWFEKP